MAEHRGAWAGITLFSGGVVVLAQTKPQDAVSNLTAWLRLAGVDGANLPAYFDTGATVAGAVVFAVSLWLWWPTAKRTEARLEREELAKLRAHGRARKTYEKELEEVPKQAGDLEMGMGDKYENNGIVHGNMGHRSRSTQSAGCVMTEGTDMIENVARAICRATYSQFAWTDEERDTMVDRDWKCNINEAKAAIAAMTVQAEPVAELRAEITSRFGRGQ